MAAAFDTRSPGHPGDHRPPERRTERRGPPVPRPDRTAGSGTCRRGLPSVLARMTNQITAIQFSGRSAFIETRGGPAGSGADAPRVHTFPEVVADYDCCASWWRCSVMTQTGCGTSAPPRAGGTTAWRECVRTPPALRIRVIMQVRPALSYAIWSTEATTGRFIPQRSHTPTSRRPTRHDHHGQPVPESGERGRKGFIGPSIRSDSAAMPLVPPTRCGH